MVHIPQVVKRNKMETLYVYGDIHGMGLSENLRGKWTKTMVSGYIKSGIKLEKFEEGAASDCKNSMILFYYSAVKIISIVMKLTILLKIYS